MFTNGGFYSLIFPSTSIESNYIGDRSLEREKWKVNMLPLDKYDQLEVYV